MTTTAQNLIDQTNDYLGNYTTSSLDPGAKLRAINRSIEYLKSRLGFPSDETIQRFYFSEDQNFIPLNVDFDEAIGLFYNNPLLNIKDRTWDYLPYLELMQQRGDGSANFLFSHTTINGSNQLMMIGSNLIKGTMIDSLDVLGTWVASGDASGLAVDGLQKYLGSGSLSFDVTHSTGTATLTKTGVSLNFQSLFENHGYIKLWTRLADIDVTNIILRLYVDSSNYYSITETDQDDASAFVASQWIKIGFPLDNVVATGTPTISSTFTKIELRFTVTSGATASDYRIDHIFTSVPDYMDLVYYTRYKGTDATGVTNKINLTTASDIVRIGNYFDDYQDIIARRAALSLSPQLRGDKDFYAVYASDFAEMMKTLGRRFPRKRITNNFLRHVISR